MTETAKGVDGVVTAEIALARAAAGELLSALDLAAIFRIKPAQCHRLERAGAFEQFKVHPPIGPKRFSGFLVQRYLRGESLVEGQFVERSFGRRRSRT